MIRVQQFQQQKIAGEKIAMLTAYSSWMARLLREAGVDLLLVGDSLGMVELGYSSTIPVTMDDMVRHSRAVRNGAPEAFVVADMPFLSYQTSEADALRQAGRLVQEGGASAVKLEGGANVAGAVRRIVDAGIPVMGHLGLLPQSVHQQGGYRQQAREAPEQARLLEDAQRLQDAGVFALVVECIPEDLAAKVTGQCRMPVIGIGAGPHCDGQVLVFHDLLGLGSGRPPSFAKQYDDLGGAVRDAVRAYVAEVRSGEFPASQKGDG